MTFATREQLLAVASVDTQGIDIAKELQRAENSIIRLLNEVWFRKFLTKNPQYQATTLRANLLAAEEWQLPTIYYALAYNIYPKIAQLTATATFREQAEYHNLWELSIRNLLEFGITYDPLGTTLQDISAEPETDYIRMRT